MMSEKKTTTPPTDDVHVSIRDGDKKNTKIVTLPGVQLPVEPNPEQAEKYFKPLGHHKGQFYFLTSRGKQVITLTHTHLAKKAALFMLAPLNWWEREFPSEKGFTGKAVDQATNYLVGKCYNSGVFRLDRMRGRGAWWDEGRAVLHAGDRLIVDGIEMPLQEIESNYVYEALPILRIDLGDPLSSSEASRLHKFCQTLNWEQPLYATLLAGWATIAPVSGALPWRPHIMITGPTGCGKSWVSEVIQRIFGDFVIAAKGDTSEAGIRQALQHDALPVMWDEAEGEDQRTAQNMDRVLGLMRQSSAEVGGRIYKGSSDGSANTYTIRSMFCLSAIRVPLKQTADENRVCVLTLKKNSPDDTRRFQSKILPLSLELTTDEWTARFRARVITMLPTLRQNIEIFAKAAGLHFLSQRMGDQIGPLIAGAYLLYRDDVVTVDDAMAWLKKQDWADQEQLQEESDEEKLLNALKESIIRIPLERGSIDLSVGELIRIAHGKDFQTDISSAEADKVLARHGMLVTNDNLIVSNTHRAIRQLLINTSWSVGWGRILRRIDGASPTRDKKSFAGSVSRGVEIPICGVLGEST